MSEEMEDVRGLEAVVEAGKELGQRLATPIALDPDTLYLVNRTDENGNTTPGVLDLEKHRAFPWRKTGIYHFHTPGSFAEYVLQHRRDDDKVRTTIWANQREGVLEAVLDDHAPKGPQWCEHRARLVVIPTPAWVAWSERNETMMAQREFAEHIEDHVDDVVSPTGATMLEIAQNFQAKNTVAFSSADRLASGEVQLTYREDIEAKGGGPGRFVIPSVFEIGLQVYEGGDAYKFHARLRYRIREGKLTLGYFLQNPEITVKQAFADVVETVSALTGTVVFMGTPTNASAPVWARR